MSLGVHYYLRKPVDLEEFRDVITSVMGEVLETEKRQEENGKSNPAYAITPFVVF